MAVFREKKLPYKTEKNMVLQLPSLLLFRRVLEIQGFRMNSSSVNELFYAKDKIPQA